MEIQFLEFSRVFLALSYRWLSDSTIKYLTQTPDITKENQEKWFWDKYYRRMRREYHKLLAAAQEKKPAGSGKAGALSDIPGGFPLLHRIMLVMAYKDDFTAKEISGIFGLAEDKIQAELDKLCVVDRYPSDSIVFSSHGYDLHIDNELVAEAFSALPQMEQSILILHCTLDLADGEIGNLVGMSRSAVQRHRTKALQELREALSALMPKGG